MPKDYRSYGEVVVSVIVICYNQVQYIEQAVSNFFDKRQLSGMSVCFETRGKRIKFLQILRSCGKNILMSFSFSCVNTILCAIVGRDLSVKSDVGSVQFGVNKFSIK